MQWITQYPMASLSYQEYFTHIWCINKYRACLRQIATKEQDKRGLHPFVVTNLKTCNHKFFLLIQPKSCEQSHGEFFLEFH